MTVVLRQSEQSIETNVDEKVKFPTDSRNTTENVSTIDRRVSLSVIGCDANRDKNIICAAFYSGYSDVLAKETMEMLDSKTFMVTLREDIVV